MYRAFLLSPSIAHEFESEPTVLFNVTRERGVAYLLFSSGEEGYCSAVLHFLVRGTALFFLPNFSEQF